MDIKLIEKARAIIGGLTPMAFDCGSLCEKACCLPDEDGQGGVHLFPGEEELISPCGWCHIDSPAGSIAPIAICDGPCERDSRPLACRIFPLTPVKNGGRWNLRMDARARAMCPLAPSGVKAVDPEFARAVLRAIRLIASDPEGEAFLEKWQALEEQYRGFRL
jgi:hypothetical protein